MLALAILFLAAGRLPAAAAPEVHDRAHFFKPDTIEKVNSVLLEIQKKVGKDLTIETVAAIPENLKAKFKSESSEDFFEHWTEQEGKRAQTNGVFILIVRNPSHFHISMGKTTRLKAFTLQDRDELRDVVLKRFRADQFDAGIVEAANFVLNRMERNTGAQTPAAIQPTTLPSTLPTTLPTTLPSAGAATAPTTRPADKPAEPSK